MSYQETLDWLFSQLPVFQRIGKAAYKANLDNTYSIMKLLDQPHKKFKSIHVAGTNGKGSVSHLLASVFQEAGYKTGLYTSPHLRDFRERIRMDGKMIAEQKVVEFVEKYKDDFLRIKPSFFEMTVGLAFSYFADEQVDIAIIETGLGGRLDSTNIIFPEVSVITNIGLDHMQFLGDTMQQIAAEKAGIIKKDIPVIVGERQAEIESVFIDKAREIQTSIQFADDIFSAQWKDDGIEIFKNHVLHLFIDHFPLKGNYQLKNICSAYAAAELLKISQDDINLGFSNVVKNTAFAGRWQVMHDKPLCICDTAHNKEGLKFVMQQISQISYNKLHMVIGVVDDKALDSVLSLFPKDAQYYFCKADIPRGLSANILAKKASEFNLFGDVFLSVKEAYQAAKNNAETNDLVFVGGSTFTVAEVV